MRTSVITIITSILIFGAVSASAEIIPARPGDFKVKCTVATGPLYAKAIKKSIYYYLRDKVDENGSRFMDVSGLESELKDFRA